MRIVVAVAKVPSSFQSRETYAWRVVAGGIDKTPDNAGSSDSLAHACSKNPASPDENDESDPDLAGVIEAWPTLGGRARVAILALVEGAGAPEGRVNA
jgi:hypothetical protein